MSQATLLGGEEANLSNRWRHRIVAELLPFWATAGFDPVCAAFRERLSFSAEECPSVPRRAMVQARQIFVFSSACTDSAFPGGAEMAARALANLLETYLDEGDPRRGFAFSVDQAGRRVSEARDSYTHVFILFALAAHYRLTGERRLIAVADATLNFIDTHLVCAAHGGLFDVHPQKGSAKRQNPVMHFLEACLALHEASGGGAYMERADAIVRLFEERLFRRERGVLPEVFAADWSNAPNASAHFEPGHHFEWIWLLDWHRRLGGRSVSDFADRLWETALRHGLNESGRCYDEVGLDLKPTKRSTRLWPHAEGLKAAVIRLSAGDGRGRELANSMLRALDETFLGRPFYGGWIDHFDAHGEPCVDYVPASSLYHLYAAYRELNRFPDRRLKEARLDALEQCR